MIAKHHDDRVICIAAGVHLSQQPAHLLIRVSHRCEVVLPELTSHLVREECIRIRRVVLVVVAVAVGWSVGEI